MYYKTPKISVNTAEMSTASETLALMVRGFLHIFARFGVSNSAITNDRSQCCDAQSFDIWSFCCPPKQHGDISTI